MSELEKVSLARILCDNSDIETMQPDAFRLVSTRYQSVAAREWQQSGPLSLVEECRGSSLIGRELPQWCLRKQSHAIKNQLGHWGYFAWSPLVLYGIRTPIIGPFRGKALDQWDTSHDIPRPMRVDQTGYQSMSAREWQSLYLLDISATRCSNAPAVWYRNWISANGAQNIR